MATLVQVSWHPWNLQASKLKRQDSQSTLKSSPVVQENRGLSNSGSSLLATLECQVSSSAQVSRLIFTLARARAWFVIYHFREILWHYLNQHTCITRIFSYAIASKLSMIWYACVFYWIKIYFICSKFWWYDFKGAVQVVNLEIFNLFFQFSLFMFWCVFAYKVIDFMWKSTFIEVRWGVFMLQSYASTRE